MFYRLFYPRQTLMLSASHDGKSNVTVADWAMPASMKPPMVAVALNNKSFSLELASSSKTFVLSVVPESMKEKAAAVGSATGRVIDKVEEYQLRLKPAKIVKAPLLDGAIAWVECEVQAIINAGDHSILVGEVVETHFPDEEAGKTPMLFNWGNKNYFGIQREWKEEKMGREESKREDTKAREKEDTRLAVVKKEKESLVTKEEKKDSPALKEEKKEKEKDSALEKKEKESHSPEKKENSKSSS